MKFHIDGSQPKGQIFVFGSNQSGIHGAGAAAAAAKYYGAQYGQGFGLHGMTYAIPTKDWKIESLSLDEIRNYVDTFLKYAESAPKSVEFFVTRIGCGLAGYTDAQIAPMFRGAGDNCSFAEDWREFLE